MIFLHRLSRGLIARRVGVFFHCGRHTRLQGALVVSIPQRLVAAPVPRSRLGQSARPRGTSPDGYEIRLKMCVIQCLVNQISSQPYRLAFDIHAYHTGSSSGICAYFGTRRAVSAAHIITMPYPALLHRGTRESLGALLR